MELRISFAECKIFGLLRCRKSRLKFFHLCQIFTKIQRSFWKRNRLLSSFFLGNRPLKTLSWRLRLLRAQTPPPQPRSWPETPERGNWQQHPVHKKDPQLFTQEKSAKFLFYFLEYVSLVDGRFCVP